MFGRIDLKNAHPQPCDLCKLRKLKCDRKDPQCSRCLKLNLPCSYSKKCKPHEPPKKLKLQLDKAQWDVTLGNNWYDLSNAILNNYDFKFSMVNSGLLPLPKEAILMLLINISPNNIHLKLNKSQLVRTSRYEMIRKWLITANHQTYKVIQPTVHFDINHQLKFNLLNLYEQNIYPDQPFVPPAYLKDLIIMGKNDPCTNALISMVFLMGCEFLPTKLAIPPLRLYLVHQIQKNLPYVFRCPGLMSIQVLLLMTIYRRPVCHSLPPGFPIPTGYHGGRMCLNSGYHLIKRNRHFSELKARSWLGFSWGDMLNSFMALRPTLLPEAFNYFHDPIYLKSKSTPNSTDSLSPEQFVNHIIPILQVFDSIIDCVASYPNLLLPSSLRTPNQLILPTKELFKESNYNEFRAKVQAIETNISNYYQSTIKHLIHSPQSSKKFNDPVILLPSSTQQHDYLKFTLLLHYLYVELTILKLTPCTITDINIDQIKEKPYELNLKQLRALPQTLAIIFLSNFCSQLLIKNRKSLLNRGGQFHWNLLMLIGFNLVEFKNDSLVKGREWGERSTTFFMELKEICIEGSKRWDLVKGLLEIFNNL
ncbi:hypothetical protein CONCODRAFT_77312 [Conidiobolus coronatus NRRL 28638]|uniref:Zn(2)-C6 fungal-type domain-containing protein n=1 Tax=Conidiobolus coronatus (strain ATCC 28846 / CBS 209.66 / NRRL 28638) TaxID=796925 RepID=A0A137PF46_CONC2|nr:hypothetical protein CONCODRAFT_77312 [Conidiobolus coronatus NRRL 28638]|eukprot:KXN73571.1 hypothetical protein CONCODRAFT_77312 [Conidiobolus coronatus NRRL 28638]